MAVNNLKALREFITVLTFIFHTLIIHAFIVLYK